MPSTSLPHRRQPRAAAGAARRARRARGATSTSCSSTATTRRSASAATSRTCSPRRPSAGPLILIHDTTNEEVRAGVDRVRPRRASAKVVYADLDAVSGRLFRAESLRNQLWGGLGIVVVDDARARARGSRRAIRASSTPRPCSRGPGPAHRAGRRCGAAAAPAGRRPIRGTAGERAPADRARLARAGAVRRRRHRPLRRRDRAGPWRPVAEVTVFTTERHRAPPRRARGGIATRASRTCGSASSPSRGRGRSRTSTAAGCIAGARTRSRRVAAAYPDGGPDLVEFSDFLGEGFVTAQAARSLDPRLRRTKVCVRLHTTAEITDVLNGHLPADLEPRITLRARAIRAHPLRPRALARRRRARHLRAPARGAAEPGHGPQPARLRAGAAPTPARAAADPGGAGPLRLLYVGRLERRKGVLDLARAVSGIAGDGVRLTMVGGDTETAPLGQSMRAMLELDDRRRPEGAAARPAAARRAARTCSRATTSSSLPSLWECWPTVGLEALERNRPLLATPTGGFTEMVEPGRSGWLTDGVGADAAGARRSRSWPPSRTRVRALGARTARRARSSSGSPTPSGSARPTRSSPPRRRRGRGSRRRTAERHAAGLDRDPLLPARGASSRRRCARPPSRPTTHRADPGQRRLLRARGRDRCSSSPSATGSSS